MGTRQIPILVYNAFTREPFAGNPAGVVLDASALDQRLMQHIARQLNLAETAFLAPAESREADVRLRWFTPAREVTLCGHATIAAFTAAAEQGVYPTDPGEERTLHVETLSGILTIGIRREEHPRVSMQIPIPNFQPLQVDRDHFAELSGVPSASLAGEWWVHRDLEYWYVPVQSRQALATLRLQPEGLAELDDQAAFTFFCFDTVDAASHWHLRFFAPFHGVAEDIVTGSAQGPMGVLYQRLTGEEKDGWWEYTGEQGDILGRPGRVSVTVGREGGRLTDVRIAGGAVLMLKAELRI
jgi:PhzF family phenazine biosynthesis protein